MRKPITVVEIFGAYNKISIVKKQGQCVPKFELLGIDKVVKYFTENDIALIIDGVDNIISIYGLNVISKIDHGVDNQITIY
jgi:hypothetical protein